MRAIKAARSEKKRVAKAGQLRAIAHMDKVPRVTLVQTVTERLIGLIESGKIRPGETLPAEPELMQMLDVGRSSIREAVGGLVVVGILQKRPKTGTAVVSTFANEFGRDLAGSTARWVLEDLYRVRAVLEGFGVEQATALMTDQKLVRIREINRVLESRIRSGRPYFEQNRRLHLFIAESSRNSVLVTVLKNLLGGMKDLREQVIARADDIRGQDIDDHRNIIDAIENGNGKRARTLMEQHILRAVKIER